MSFNSILVRKSAEVLTQPRIRAILKLNCDTSLLAFRKEGRIAFVWKKLVTDLLSVKTIVGFDASHKLCTDSKIDIKITKNFFE